MIAMPGKSYRGPLPALTEEETALRDALRTADGRIALAIRYVEGRTLRALLEELHTVPETLLREIARAVLEKARARGIPVANVPDYGTEDVADTAIGTVKPESIQPLSQAPCCKSTAMRVLIKSGTLAMAVTRVLEVPARFAMSAWVSRPERLQGAPLIQRALRSQTPARVHLM